VFKINPLPILALLAAMCLSCTSSVEARHKVGSSGSDLTTLEIVNASNIQEVATTITVPAGSVCGSVPISQLRVTSGVDPVTIQPLGSSGLQGWFNVKRGYPVVVKNPNGGCLGGVNIAFIAPPQCPCSSCSGFVPFVPFPSPLPNGVCQAEVTLNTPGSNQEACNLSANTGANATINMTATGGPQWTAPFITPTFNITNSWVNVAGQADNNCNIPGVLGYQLTTCTGGAHACPGGGPFCHQNKEDCIFQRVPVDGHYGGTIRVSFIGPLSPP
jgi:hypothetical protein